MSAQPEDLTSSSSFERGEDYRTRSIVLFTLMIAALIGGSIALSIVVLRAAIKPPSSEEISASPESTPSLQEPLLQTEPQADLAALRQAQQQILQSYAWIDRATGIVRIPIDRAIDHAVAHGLPSLQSPKPPGGP